MTKQDKFLKLVEMGLLTSCFAACSRKSKEVRWQSTKVLAVDMIARMDVAYAVVGWIPKNIDAYSAAADFLAFHAFGPDKCKLAPWLGKAMDESKD